MQKHCDTTRSVRQLKQLVSKSPNVARKPMPKVSVLECGTKKNTHPCATDRYQYENAIKSRRSWIVIARSCQLSGPCQLTDSLGIPLFAVHRVYSCLSTAATLTFLVKGYSAGVAQKHLSLRPHLPCAVHALVALLRQGVSSPHFLVITESTLFYLQTHP